MHGQLTVVNLPEVDLSVAHLSPIYSKDLLDIIAVFAHLVDLSFCHMSDHQ